MRLLTKAKARTRCAAYLTRCAAALCHTYSRVQVAFAVIATVNSLKMSNACFPARRQWNFKTAALNRSATHPAQ